MISKQEFEQLKPYTRGYVVGIAGWLDDRTFEPNVPDEKNPYELFSGDYLAYNRGLNAAGYEAQLVDEWQACPCCNRTRTVLKTVVQRCEICGDKEFDMADMPYSKTYENESTV